jgi:hypothetical protein
MKNESHQDRLKELRNLLGPEEAHYTDGQLQELDHQINEMTGILLDLYSQR